MTEATRPSTHRVPARMKRSGRARLRPSRSAGRALFEHRDDGPPVPSKHQAGSVAPPGTPSPRAVRQLHTPRSARLPRRQLVGYRGPWPSAMRGCRVAVVTGCVVNGRLIGHFSNVIVNRWGKTWCGIWCGFINNGWPPVVFFSCWRSAHRSTIIVSDPTQPRTGEN